MAVQPAGRWFEAYSTRRRHQQTLSHHSLQSTSSEESSGELSDDDEGDDVLLNLDPKKWKDQDHYAVMGLSKLRYRATDIQIKKAC